ncbi:MAG: NAD(P)-dependent oxidoreductase, partial [Actinomycetota bacterium]|nr:NAD(P)-dependent oxidoreductase [Actinomycetota bacterium]
MSTEFKVVITGGHGQLATDLALTFDAADTLVLSREDLDISRPEAVDSIMLRYRPEIVINTAAWTDVDGCESNETKARSINSWGPKNVVASAQKCGARVVQISTDYVFDGLLDRPYVERDRTNPQSIYGQTKLEGELAMREQDLIVRTSWLCGLHGSNILKTIVNLALSETPMVFVDDQI